MCPPLFADPCTSSASMRCSPNTSIQAAVIARITVSSVFSAALGVTNAPAHIPFHSNDLQRIHTGPFTQNLDACLINQLFNERGHQEVLTNWGLHVINGFRMTDRRQLDLRQGLRPAD